MQLKYKKKNSIQIVRFIHIWVSLKIAVQNKGNKEQSGK